jgi:transposase
MRITGQASAGWNPTDDRIDTTSRIVNEVRIGLESAEEFAQLVRERNGAGLGAWLNRVDAIPSLRTFAAGLRRDEAAVRAGLTLPWSNGPVEGAVNRLKLLKRSGYGRAKFDLLRARVLHSH